MALAWARLDVNVGSHDKILELLADPSPKRWQAAFSYVTSISWSVGHGTNGEIRSAALPFVHGSQATARLLVKYDLWQERTASWRIKNFAEYQQLDAQVAATSAAKRAAGAKGNCERWHGPDCKCWEEAS